ncbi:Glutathione transport system permease protein GsiC [Paenibacillus plantiphilus]|uniref:Glutathione transport system permease protein GsiC n=1 Tax=Paenibacillus plantiphilus TaxID=2905650 RepID=A0ABM9C631_9BACL|nr:ABC transporter permease [Paenibacillus plantiphilus]CAH1203675.1 Glutathione transport system permease protein GsiC [Paenibacillus plantiphilus]
MGRYIVRRLLIAIPVFFGITLLSFLIMNMAPGNPVDMLINPNTPKEMLELKKELLGLNDPLHVQYLKWLGGFLQGELGYSFSSFAPVSQLIGERIGPTLLLASASLLLGILIAIPAGIISAVHQNSRLDYMMTALSFLGTSIPPFFLGLGLIYVMGIELGWLPTGGMTTLGGTGGIGDIILHMILPVTVLGVTIAGKKVRYVRASMLDVLQQDYLRTARAKGLSEFMVTNKHALRNALIPIITVVGAEIPLLLGGSIIMEQVFQWPGIGQLTMEAILSRDYPTLMGLNLIAACIVLSMNLVTDILYATVDPRITYS